MPIFEYQCKKCGHVMSVLERVGTEESHECANCGSSETEKIFSSFSAGRTSSSSTGDSSCPTGTCPLP
ncbi:MAG: zinc ribbon domain-containing protein [Deltaproteobacteria bacterium]|nr:zinc ribbon domain-containing protein [Deltaproteobacteria bacterium]MBW1962595.1 zinc ribbon domain-containing protein [Deltaproteobacteria bacterium]